MKNTRAKKKQVSAEAIARMADKGKDVSQLLLPGFRVPAPP
jgi:hypothetical protein